tara:strand:- start:891 stop:1052 length:162 start_codon:yes stop_codon:yes gene_type:complete
MGLEELITTYPIASGIITFLIIGFSIIAANFIHKVNVARYNALKALCDRLEVE